MEWLWVLSAWEFGEALFGSVQSFQWEFAFAFGIAQCSFLEFIDWEGSDSLFAYGYFGRRDLSGKVLRASDDFEFFIDCLDSSSFGFFILLAFVLAFLWKSEAKWKIKSLVLGGILVLGGLVYFLLGKVLGAPEGLVQKVLDLYTVHNSYLKRTSSYVPMEDYVYPYKLFSFYFRPLPFEKSGLLYGIVSFENLLVLIVFGLVVYWILKLFPWMKAGVFLAFVFLFLLFHGSMYAFGYANYGLIIRTKSLVLPFLVLLVMEVRGGPRKKY